MPDTRENKINYIEIPVKNIAQTKDFFSKLFGWEFVDFGPDYCSFVKAGMDGGFFKADTKGCSSENCPLIVFYAYDIEKAKDRVISLSGSIVKDIFSFPGGRRFHFADLNNNEYAIWTDKPE